MQCGAARNGELISVSLCNDEEQIHIEGNPKHIVAALKEALGAIEAVLAHPPTPPATILDALAQAELADGLYTSHRGCGDDCDDPGHRAQPQQAQASAETEQLYSRAQVDKAIKEPRA